jgi:hypothetical protein
MAESEEISKPSSLRALASISSPNLLPRCVVFVLEALLVPVAQANMDLRALRSTRLVRACGVDHEHFLLDHVEEFLEILAAIFMPP